MAVLEISRDSGNYQISTKYVIALRAEILETTAFGWKS